MTQYKYSTKNYNKELMARAVGRDLSISTKQSVEICNFLRNKKLETAKSILQGAIQKKKPIPFKRYNKDMGHKRGNIAAGRYPVKACEQILSLIESVEANAQFKGLSTGNLVLKFIKASKARRPWHFGRKRRRKMKRSHIEVIVEEGVEKKKEVPKKTKEEAPKKETKPTEQKKDNKTQKTPTKTKEETKK